MVHTILQAFHQEVVLEYQGAVTLSKDEQRKFIVIEKYRNGTYSRREAAHKLGRSERQITRMAKKVRDKGFRGILHGNVGKIPWNKISEEFVQRYVDLYRSKYSKFNYSHALEMMALHEEMENLSYTKFRKACREQGLGKVRKRRTRKARVARERFAEEGYMWQLDGSPEAWDGKDTTSLIALIDDATSKVPNAKLYPSETTWACMNVVREAISRYGKPEFILTDMAGWSSSNGRKRVHFSQFERACLELDISVIATPTAESKGRVERLNRTFQDRLIPELDLYNIKGLKDCNRYLKQVFIPSWNKKFTVEPANPKGRYRKLEAHEELKEIFCLKSTRVVNRDHTVQYGARRYRIRPDQGAYYKGREVSVHEYEDKSISIYYGSKKLSIELLKKPKSTWEKCA